MRLIICVRLEVLDQIIPRPELFYFSRIVCSLKSRQLPFAILGGSSSLARVLIDSRDDGRVLVVYQYIDTDVFFRCIRQAYQDVFSMVEVTSLVDYTILRLKTAVYENWMEGTVVLCNSVRQGFVELAYFQRVLTDLIDLWPSYRSSVVQAIQRPKTRLIG